MWQIQHGTKVCLINRKKLTRINRCFVTFILKVVICNSESAKCIISQNGEAYPFLGLQPERGSMWYAVQVETGKEDDIKDYCINLLENAVYNDIFILRFNHAKKFYGKWHEESKVMFPGYMFIDTETPEQVYEALKKVPVLTKVLGRDKDEFIPIERSKEQLFKEMINDKHEIEVSVGLIEGDRITITHGPLAGKEAMICKINRHKRTATLDVEMFGEMVGVTVGLEVVEKRE